MKIDDLIINNNIPELKTFVYQYDYRLNYALSTASGFGFIEIARNLLEWKADVHTDMESPLTRACSSGRTEMAKLLIEHKADSTFPSAINLAADGGYTDIVRLLVNHKADVIKNRKPMRLACTAGNLDTVKALVELKADLGENLYNYSPIHFASTEHHDKVVMFLLSKGSDLQTVCYSCVEYYEKLYREYLAYSKWRRLHLRKWIRKVLIPLYYSPQFQGGIRVKEELNSILN